MIPTRGAASGWVISLIACASLQQAWAADSAASVLKRCQEAGTASPPAQLAFSALPSVPAINGLIPKIGNGKVQDRRRWPASVWASTAKPPKWSSFSCSGTLIGHRVLLTAAHCIQDKGTAYLFEGDKQIASGVCTHADGWKSHGVPSGEDWALCLMSEMPEPNGGPGGSRGFEAVSTGAPLNAATLIQLTGFGCDENHQTDGRFIAGYAEIGLPPSQMTALAATPYYEAGTGTSGPSAFVCRGDSGGAGYLTFPGGVRRVVAVNSVQAIEDGTGRYGSCSAALASDQGRSFLKAWLARDENKGAAICGISPDARKCRQTDSH